MRCKVCGQEFDSPWKLLQHKVKAGHKNMGISVSPSDSSTISQMTDLDRLSPVVTLEKDDDPIPFS